MDQVYWPLSVKQHIEIWPTVDLLYGYYLSQQTHTRACGLPVSHTCDLFPHCSLNKNKRGRSQMDVIDPLHLPMPNPTPLPTTPQPPTGRGFHIIYILPPRKSGNYLAPKGNSHSAYEAAARRPHLLFRSIKREARTNGRADPEESVPSKTNPALCSCSPEEMRCRH